MSSLIRRIQRMPTRTSKGAIKRMNTLGFGSKLPVKVKEEEENLS